MNVWNERKRINQLKYAETSSMTSKMTVCCIQTETADRYSASTNVIESKSEKTLHGLNNQ